MRENFGGYLFEVGVDVVARVGRKVFWGHFSPMEATEETWIMMCGVEVEVEGMIPRARLRLGQPQRGDVDWSGGWRVSLEGTLAMRAPRMESKA